MSKKTLHAQDGKHPEQDDARPDGEVSVLVRTFTRWRSQLMAYVSHMTGRREEAEDILQEAFVKLWSAGKHPSNEAETKAVLLTTVRNITVSEWRKKQVRNEIPIEHAPHSMYISDTNDDAMHREELFNSVQQIIEQHLTPMQKTIIELREYEDLDFDTIAKRFDTSATAIRMQLSRARKVIRECYRMQQEQLNH